MEQKTGNELRSAFVAFFTKECEHTFVRSSSLLPADDPTLLFTNAGMNQFKNSFLGTENRPYARAVNSQKCIRAGGKHNDLEDVGRDCYHHTFFEMLGNWSFGDYFKAEAIGWAWRLLTETWGIAPDRLHATWFEGDPAQGLAPDEESADLWRQYLPPGRIHTGDQKDNFWEMGDTGPCGPCSEIHIDLTPDRTGTSLVNAGDPRVMELWNLVFIQHNRGPDGALDALPAVHVDTGMGLERLAAVMQGRQSNYATDLFVPVIARIEEIAGTAYGAGADAGDRYDAADEENLVDVAMRVIADHVRALTFAVADGIRISNEGRGYVLRSILRRAAGFGRRELGVDRAFLHEVVPVVVDTFAGAYPEIAARQDAVIEQVREEEESFGKTLEKGLDMFEVTFEKVKAEGGSEVTAPETFMLHATYGFPVTLTKLMAEKRGLSVDVEGFEREMEAHRETSRADGGTFDADSIVGLPATDDAAKYAMPPIEATVLGWVADGAFVADGALEAGDEAAVILDKTNFYAEAGGQVGDRGRLDAADGAVFTVEAAQAAGASVLHVGRVVAGRIAHGQQVTARVAPERLDISRNHTATHLLNGALKAVLDPDGSRLEQAGSVVAPDRLRFDFTWNAAVTPDQLAEIERLVNARILAGGAVVAEFRPLDEAKTIPGVRAVFGERYPDPVRVVRIEGPDGPVSTEFCGGAHLDRIERIGLFKILTEESVAKGVRRITAVTGRAAADWARRSDALLRELSGILSVPPDEAPDRVRAMQKEIKKLKKKPGGGGGGTLADVNRLDTPAGQVLVARAAVPDPGAIRGICDRERQAGAAAVFIGAADEEAEKVMMIAMVADELIAAGQLKAGDWVGAVAPVVGGGGGGKPRLAQAGGKQPGKLGEALAAAARYAAEQLG